MWEWERREWAAENHLEPGPVHTTVVMLVPIRKRPETWNMPYWAISLSDFPCESRNPRYRQAIQGFEKVMTFA